MRSCIVLGSGRSGTSMVTGALAGAGFSMGGSLHLPRASNPKGFFEAAEVNAINEELLAPMLPPSPALRGGQRWIGVPRADARAAATPELEERMRAVLGAAPYCLKDPRFSFTLPAWRPHLGDAAFVCVFRDPALTATSILREVREARYMRGVEIDLDHAFALWEATYRAALEHAAEGDWLFLHYDQVLEPSGLAALARHVEAEIDRGFPDPKLRRARPEAEVPEASRALYDELCARAGHAERPTAPPPPATATPDVSVLAWIADGDERHVAELVEDVRAQRGVQAELVLVDATRAGGLACEDARVVRARTPARGEAWIAALRVARGRHVAWQTPGCRSLPSRLAHALEALETERRIELVTCDLFLCDEHGQFVGRAHPGEMGEAPCPFWESGVVMRREALASIRRTVFHPVELQLYQRLRAAGRTAHVTEPGVTVPLARYEARWERSRQDAALLALAARPFPDEVPDVTVSLCTYQRKDVLLECLEAFSRQLLPPGTFEIVLVDDGSTDGTSELVGGLEFPVPVRHVRQPNGGLSAARNAGLELARGRLVLFVNDDTIPFPDLVERHLRAHAALPEPGCVLGSFEQPPEALGTALARAIERSDLVFAFATMRAGATYDWTRFATCNLSVPLAAVRRAGGFDESFRHYGCEDTDLALRLEALGLRVHYRPEARSLHRHVLSFDDLARRQRTVARAYVRLFRKHPQALARWGNEGLGARWCREQLAERRVERARLEAAARALARLDVAALERLDGAYRAAAEEAVTRLGALLADLNRAWWLEGYLQGFEEHRVGGFTELAEAAEPWPIDAEAPRRLLALPRWDDPEELRELLARAAPLAGRGTAALVLRFDPRGEVPREEALRRLEEAYERAVDPSLTLEVVLEEAPLGRRELLRLGRSVDAFLPLGGEREGERRAIAAEPLATEAAVRAWAARFAEDAPAPLPLALVSARTAPELSVIVPTYARPAALERLLRGLAAQDLEPERFEVIVVDDGSPAPVEEAVRGVAARLPLRVLRQENSGPARARNVALGSAEGDVVLFLNDDAVVAPDLLRRHLAAHRHAQERRAALGSFRLRRELLRTSLAHFAETSTVFFAQPAMKAGVLYHGLSFCTGNVSVPRAALLEVAGFDESLPYAGGEDSELGLRLERELGLRVLFDPTLRASHDHALDVDQLVHRQCVVGWATWRIQEKHPDVEIAGGRLRASAWLDLRRELETVAPAMEELRLELARVHAEETAGDRTPDPRALRPKLETLATYSFRRGLLLGHDGALPAPAPAASALAPAGDLRPHLADAPPPALPAPADAARRAP